MNAYRDRFSGRELPIEISPDVAEGFDIEAEPIVEVQDQPSPRRHVDPNLVAPALSKRRIRVESL